MKLIRRGLATLLAAALLTGSAFAAPVCSSWFIAELSALSEAGMLPAAFNDADLTQPITRQEVCQMAMAFWGSQYEIPAAEAVFYDTDDPDVSACAALGLVSGYGDGNFGPADPLSRQQLFCIAAQLLQLLGVEWAGDPALLDAFYDRYELAGWATDAAALLLSLDVIEGSNGLLSPLETLTREQTLAVLWRVWQQAAPEPDWFDFSTDLEPEPSQSEPETALDPWDEPGYESYTDKYIRIFGSADAPKYQTEEEAAAHMVTITVPVWNFNYEHVKVQTSRTLVVHEAIADIVMAVFTEIYNGSERFPIYSVGGYAWRGDGRSEHNWGIAIDINPDENYYVYHGVPTVGSHWLPGEDPYSIPADGDVVRAFAKYGFAWGGNAWQSSQDYMHFSYFGE